MVAMQRLQRRCAGPTGYPQNTVLTEKLEPRRAGVQGRRCHHARHVGLLVPSDEERLVHDDIQGYHALAMHVLLPQRGRAPQTAAGGVGGKSWLPGGLHAGRWVDLNHQLL